MRIIFCPHTKGVSKFPPKEDPVLAEEHKKDICSGYASRVSKGGFLVCHKKIEEENRN